MLRQLQFFIEALIAVSNSIDTLIVEQQRQRENLPSGSVKIRVKGGSCYFRHCANVDGNRVDKYISSEEAAIISGQIYKRNMHDKSVKYTRTIQSIISKVLDSKFVAIPEEIEKLQASMDERTRITMSYQEEEEKQIFLEYAGLSFPKFRGGETIRLHNSNGVFLNVSEAKSKYGNGDIKTLDDDIAVRSKSELIIVELLKAKGLEYYYEQGLLISNHVFYPDFLIRHPASGDFLIWEHCGLMSSDTYHDNWVKKLDMYTKQGVRACSNLIMTYEDENSSFSIKNIRDIIDFYFT